MSMWLVDCSPVAFCSCRPRFALPSARSPRAATTTTDTARAHSNSDFDTALDSSSYRHEFRLACPAYDRAVVPGGSVPRALGGAGGHRLRRDHLPHSIPQKESEQTNTIKWQDHFRLKCCVCLRGSACSPRAFHPAAVASVVQPARSRRRTLCLRMALPTSAWPLSATHARLVTSNESAQRDLNPAWHVQGRSRRSHVVFGRLVARLSYSVCAVTSTPWSAIASFSFLFTFFLSVGSLSLAWCLERRLSATPRRGGADPLLTTSHTLSHSHLVATFIAVDTLVA